MHMLRCFFDAPVDGYVDGHRDLFENLAVWDAGEEVRAEQGAHPVIYLNLAGATGGTWDEVRDSIAQIMAAEYVRHAYLFERDGISTFERPLFEHLATATASLAELKVSLARLSTMLRRFHGSKTVILIDEYDRPVTEGHVGGFRDEVTGFMRTWLTGALKGTVDLHLACLTGVQRVSRESIFSDLNNLLVNTPLDSAYGEAFGFTEPEVQALARYMGCEGGITEMKAWYDGYTFGGTCVYNPVSTLCYLRDGTAQPYWANTSGNAVVTRLFQRADYQTDAALRTLAEGGEVEATLNMQVVFGEIDSDTTAIWSQLYLAGYLTTDDVREPANKGLVRRLRIPNLEVRELFENEFLCRAERLATGDRLQGLHAVLLAGDAARFQEVLGSIVEESESFRDLSTEAACHMLLMGMLYEVPGYRYPVSNRESGLGVSDILLEPLQESAGRLPAIAIEVKRARAASGDDIADADALAAHARDVALRQALDRRYGAGLAGRGRTLWGVSFSGKRVACAVAELDR